MKTCYCMNWVDQFMDYLHCVKSVCIWSFSGPYFPTFRQNSISPYSVRMRENADQKNSEYEHLLRSVIHMDTAVCNGTPHCVTEKTYYER